MGREDDQTCVLVVINYLDPLRFSDALLAISFRCSGVGISALASPPRNPSSLPSATA